MRISTLDPITMHEVKELDQAPYVVEGEGRNSFIVYFESETTRAIYLDISLDAPNSDVPPPYASSAYADTAQMMN